MSPGTPRRPQASGDLETPLCAFCFKDAEGNYSIHAEGFGIGPEVPLCNAHGSRPTPTFAEIWSKLAGYPRAVIEMLARGCQ